nr:30s ribosomal protein 3, chloroplastic [Quercus suber]
MVLPSPCNNKVEGEKLGVVVKPMEKPRIVLKFIWMEKNIGIGLDQMIPGHGTIPLSPYYFWPRKDAWEELKVLLESKPWISQKQIIILLNQATDIINLWQQSGGNLAFDDLVTIQDMLAKVPIMGEDQVQRMAAAQCSLSVYLSGFLASDKG